MKNLFLLLVFMGMLTLITFLATDRAKFKYKQGCLNGALTACAFMQCPEHITLDSIKICEKVNEN